MNDRLDDSQTRQLKRLLDDRYTKLWHDIGTELGESVREHFLRVAGEAQDIEDRSFADLISDLNVSMLDKHVQETRDINDALIRVNKGTYGICEDCGQFIDFDRLLAYPTATRCVRCQQAHEKTHAGGDHYRL